jgi:hypothetical protein
VKHRSHLQHDANFDSRTFLFDTNQLIQGTLDTKLAQVALASAMAAITRIESSHPGMPHDFKLLHNFTCTALKEVVLSSYRLIIV